MYSIQHRSLKQYLCIRTTRIKPNTMAKQTTFQQLVQKTVSRPGVHAKTKTSIHKKSKHYKKAYRGQGR